jgi:phosphate transport system permease protein
MTLQKRENIDWFFKQAFKVAGLMTIALLGGIFFMLFYNSFAFFLHASPSSLGHIGHQTIPKRSLV